MNRGIKMYKYIKILFSDLDEVIVTEDMICQKWNIEKQNFTKSLKELKAHNYIIEYKNEQTQNLELYEAILNQDYNKIYEIIEGEIK